jgi:eukaryotic-like serine/threonine-protein kinase
MGSVYRARDLHFSNVTKLVAVKEILNLSPDASIRKTAIQNFEREANILATLAHSGIPRIYDYFTKEDRSYLVLEFINGEDLESIITRTEGFLDENQVISWGIELCDVLNYLHNHKPEPIIFRDMKPSNIMISQENHVVLVDFGIAKHFQSGEKGTMIGTEGYSPPEQYRGETSHSADIYSLGATLHHLLTKRDPRMEPPFSFGDRPINIINPSISPELVEVINVSLQYDPSDRFESITSMKQALIAAARKTGMLGNMDYGPSVVNKGAIKPIWTFQCEDEIRGTPTYYEGNVYVGACDNNLYSLNSADGEFTWKYATDGKIVTKPEVFDGNIYISSEDERLHAVNTRSGKVNWIYYANGRFRSSPKIAEGHIFVGSDDRHLHAINVLTGRASWKFEASAPIRSTPYIHHETVLFGTENGEFFSIDFGGNLKWKFKTKQAITSSPTVYEGMVFFGSHDSSFYALDAKGGWVIWRFRMGKGSIVSPCAADNIIFTGSADGMIYAIDTKTSKEVWNFKTDHQVSGSPILHRDSLYCGAADGVLYCIEYRTGRLRWRFDTKGTITSTPTVFDDILYIGSTDHFLYAIAV